MMTINQIRKEAPEERWDKICDHLHDSLIDIVVANPCESDLSITTEEF